MKLRLTSALLALAATTTAALAEEVRVYNWSDYIEESLLTKFTEETGIKLVYDVFDSNEVLETKLLAGGTGYDVVVPSATFLKRQISAGAFQKLDKSQLPNLGNAWDMIQARTEQYDPNGDYSVNYMWGTTGIGYNTAKVAEVLGEDAPVTSLALIFDPANAEKLSTCGFYMLDAPTEMIPAALIYLGKDPNSQDPSDIEAAGEVFKAIRPYITKFDSSEYITALANGEICAAVGWSGDVFQAQFRAIEAENGVDIAYSIPTEGAQMWFDQMAIPADAPNVSGAHKFINFLMDAENSAAASNYVYYASGNKAAQPLLEEDLIGDPAIYPDAATLDNLYTTIPYPPKVQRIVTRLWTAVKSGV